MGLVGVALAGVINQSRLVTKENEYDGKLQPHEASLIGFSDVLFGNRPTREDPQMAKGVFLTRSC